MRQLEIFAQLGYRADPGALAASPLYRNFCADSGNVPRLQSRPGVQQQPACTSASTSPLTASSRNTPLAGLEPKTPQAMAAQLRFRCRGCRQDLFYDTHVLYHARGAPGTHGQTAVERLADCTDLKDAQEKSDELAERCRFEYFITPMKWMQVDQFQGKVSDMA